MWEGALTALAAHFGVTGTVESEIICLDSRLQWSQFWNIWKNAAIRTFFYRVLMPFRLVIRKK
jgi:hypothetical protein